MGLNLHGNFIIRPNIIIIVIIIIIIVIKRPRGESAYTPVCHYWGPGYASRSLHVGFMMDEKESGEVFLGISPILRCHKFNSTIFPHVAFHNPCDGESGVVDQHPCKSQAFNKGTSSHLIPQFGLCRTRVEGIDVIIIIIIIIIIIVILLL